MVQPTLAKFRHAFSLIEMMIAIVILGLGLVMTATMFPVAWTRARTLTEYTTQKAVAQNAAAVIENTLRPSGSTFLPYVANGVQTGGYFLSTACLAGDLVYDSQLHNEPPPVGLNPDEKHKCVLAPSDTRVHALHMENLLANATATDLRTPNPDSTPGENPFAIEKPVDVKGQPFQICDTTKTPPLCERGYFNAPDNPARVSPMFYARSYYWPQVAVGARMYPPLEAPPNSSDEAAARWLQNFSNRRYAWAVLHRLKNYVGPDPQAVANIETGTLQEKAAFASQAAQSAGTTRTFDFYFVTLKRPQPTSRYAVQKPDANLLPDWNSSTPAAVEALPRESDAALPVAWRVQVEVPLAVKKANGPTATPTDPTDDPTGIPTEVQVPPTGVSGTTAQMVAGMFPAGTQFVDEISGHVYRVTRRRLTFDGSGNTTGSMLTLDRELLLEDFDNSPQFGGDGQLQQPWEVRRIVWVFPPPVAERSGESVVFDDSPPVVGIDVRSISLTPPG